MLVIKYASLIFIFAILAFLGQTMANKYKGRVKDLKEILRILNIIETKIKFTYEPLPEIFKDISKEFKSEVRKNFRCCKRKHEKYIYWRSLGKGNKKF